MKKINLLSAALTLAAVVSCKENKETSTEPTQAQQSKTYAQMEKASWLTGNWGHTSKEGALTENWVKTNDSVMHGESYFVVGGKDTVFAENVELAEMKGKLVYTVTVPGQNNEKPVPFELTSATETQLIFENPKHDYPNKIVYNKIGNDSVMAEISGMQKGKPASEKFAMKKQ